MARAVSKPSVERAARQAGLPAISLEGAGVWLVVPCYKVRDHILRVIKRTPAWFEGIVCVDDACPEGSGDFIEAENTDPRVVVIRLLRT